MSCPQGVKIAEINSQARNKLKRQKGVPLRDRIITRPTWLGRAGTPVAPLANFTLGFAAAPDPRPRRRSGVHRDAAVAGLRRPALLALVRGAPEPAPPGARSSTSTAAAPSTTSRGRARRSWRSSSTTASRSIVPKQDCCGLPLQSSGLFDDARKVVLRLRATRLAPHLRDDPDTIIVGNATSCTLMLKREAREILSLEDDPDLKLRVRADLRHLRAAARAARPRRAQDRLQAGQRAHRLPRALPAAGPLDRQAGARAVRADPRPGGHREATRAAAGSPAPTGSRRRSTTSRWRSGRTCSARFATPGPPRSRATARPAAGRSPTPPASKSVHPIDYLHRAYGL